MVDIVRPYWHPLPALYDNDDDDDVGLVLPDVMYYVIHDMCEYHR